MMARPPGAKSGSYTPTRGKKKGLTFSSKRQYENRLAQDKGFRSRYQQQKQARKVRGGEDVRGLRPAERAARGRALDALSKMRTEGLSLQAAAKASGTTVNAIKRHAGSALEKSSPNGRYRAKQTDRLARTLQFPTETGSIGLDIRDSRSASRIAAYWNAVKRYLETGDASGLRRFRGKTVRVNKRGYPFITDPQVLDRLADAGELGFDDLYDVLEAA